MRIRVFSSIPEIIPYLRGTKLIFQIPIHLISNRLSEKKKTFCRTSKLNLLSILLYRELRMESELKNTARTGNDQLGWCGWLKSTCNNFHPPAHARTKNSKANQRPARGPPRRWIGAKQKLSFPRNTTRDRHYRHVLENHPAEGGNSTCIVFLFFLCDRKRGKVVSKVQL